MLLSADDLSAFCGYQQPAAVRRWCKRNGVTFMRDKDGRPVTTQAALDRAMLPKTRTQPDFSDFETPAQMPSQPRRDLLRPSK